MSVRETEMTLLQRLGQFEIRNEPPKRLFPLLKLPRVVLVECIENLDVLEIIIFSILSKRAKSIAKFIRWNPLEISLGFIPFTDIRLRSPSDRNQHWSIYYNKEKESSEYSCFRSEKFGPKVFNTLVLKDNGNAIENLKQMTEHICEVFCSPIYLIDITDKSLIEWIINFQSTIKYLRIDDGVITSVETLYLILKNLKVTEDFRMKSTKIYEDFEIIEPILSRCISIKRSNWFTLPAILNGNNSFIELDRSNLTPKDMNTILKEWQRGLKLRNLEYLEINSVLQDIGGCTPQILKDLNPTASVRNDERPSEVKIDDENIYRQPQVPSVCDLIRDDGTIGSVFYGYREYDRERRRIVFMLHVWRRQT
ncbi:hypothetical protein L3Y34_003069 [Caenorhabditis briggsae]|uniref:F-box domain-containing protein n=1 Tax=Caenorhabditis briggsae TaxID=6238 RepID=A0AAE9A7Z0_CAEBR|nr:hypothetical protein L3Y34_003069 [Caenorhabditis briggsae]